jgi:hypothetical protein
MMAHPEVTHKGLTFLPVPEFDAPTMVFGAPESAYFDRRDLPEVPRKFRDEVSRMFFKGGEWPEFGGDVDARKAKVAIKAWLASFAPAHEAKEATVAYALWVWSPEAAKGRAAPDSHP